ncbi:MAG TPA: lipopolysaccharide heptosyltransferase I [Sulfuricurvum sp.]|nr:MAG: lipopolysaccharide heptosyltransferase I [Campylobacterales bacterium 16-40-21]OZA04370.1 MAG: lipopolysaccharide heptosyltransferase I [Sulfuricurvum sp. 17-40-25]HQS66393.1 lipopolysaccharide heptosyltransferase I [Sulfuricurvum sp.]HQT36266.1 lipopolysaccharide heptosyltransferase I [Sulfuricurvum sp.]
MNDSVSRIAIVRLSALGDIVNTAVVLQIIHDYYPNTIIHWYVEEAFAPILKDHPLIDQVIAIPLKKMKKQKSLSLLRTTIQSLRIAQPYDQIIDAQGLLKSAIVASLLPGPVHGFDRNSAREGIASWFYQTTSTLPYEMNIIKRNVMVITQALDIPYSDALIEYKAPVFLVDPLLEVEKKIALVIGASWPSKCYPKEHFAVLCDLLPFPCHLIWGSQSEFQDAQWIAQHSTNAIITDKMSLPQLVSFIAHCELTIGNDTGPTHMAWAMNRPSITLFGPTTERMIYPTSINIGIKSPSIVDIYHINRNDFSIKQIEPQYIADKAITLL